MKKKMISGSGLFLLEMMLSVLFFSIAAVICVQVFVRAHLMSREARDLNMAVSLASTGAELVTHLLNVDELVEYLPGCEKDGEHRYVVYYDQEWNGCEETSAYAWMELTVSEEGGMRTGAITVRKCGQEEPVYQLDAGKYFPEPVKEGGVDE